MLDKIFNGSRRLSLWLTWLGGSLIVLSAFLVTLEVFLRKVFNVSPVSYTHLTLPTIYSV